MQEGPREARRILRLPVRQWGSLSFTVSEPRGGPFVPLGGRGPRPPRAGLWAPSSLRPER
eukprot:5601677-Alexandrium_andersonii.AAC.1